MSVVFYSVSFLIGKNLLPLEHETHLQQQPALHAQDNAFAGQFISTRLREVMFTGSQGGQHVCGH